MSRGLIAANANCAKPLEENTSSQLSEGQRRERATALPAYRQHTDAAEGRESYLKDKGCRRGGTQWRQLVPME